MAPDDTPAERALTDAMTEHLDHECVTYREFVGIVATFLVDHAPVELPQKFMDCLYDTLSGRSLSGISRPGGPVSHA